MVMVSQGLFSAKAKWVGILFVALLSLGVAGCDSKVERENLTDKPAANGSDSGVNFCGLAPSGEYTAQRVQRTEVSGEFQGLYEGPVWVKDALYYSHFSFERGFPSRIMRLKNEHDLGVLVKSSGSNGLALDPQGHLVAASHAVKGLLRFDKNTGDQTIVVDSFQGNPFNSPNDLAFAADGTIYFTDPDFQKAAAPGGQPITGVYQVSTKGDVTLIDGTLNNPNGIALSPDQKKLYVAGGGEQGVLREYTLSDGKVNGIRDLASVVVPDGMAVDCHGNIYLTEHLAKQVRIFTPEGNQIATIKTDANVTNAAFGGADGKTLFLTGAGTLWSIKLDVTGSLNQH
jgi:gluconolactonase